MKNFETVYKELEDLFIKQFPDYINKVNIAHNDGIILKPFENTKLEEDCLKKPCFKFKLEKTEYSEKDRIIENSCFTNSFEILLPVHEENKVISLYRYFEAIDKMFEEMESDRIYRITEIKENKIIIQITD